MTPDHDYEKARDERVTMFPAHFNIANWDDLKNLEPKFFDEKADALRHAWKHGADWGYHYALRESSVVRGLVEALKHADAGMTYAFDDYGDQYYNNVNEHIQKAIKNYHAAIGSEPESKENKT